MTQGTAEQRSLGELFSDLASQTQVLLKKEVELAKVEMTQKAKVVGNDALWVGIGGAIAIGGGLVLLAALVLILATVMPAWAAALLVGFVVTLIGSVVALAAIRALKRVDATPQETVQTLKENKAWLKAEMAR